LSFLDVLDEQVRRFLVVSARREDSSLVLEAVESSRAVFGSLFQRERLVVVTLGLLEVLRGDEGEREIIQALCDGRLAVELAGERKGFLEVVFCADVVMLIVVDETDIAAPR
jgi:hypothetical protein